MLAMTPIPEVKKNNFSKTLEQDFPDGTGFDSKMEFDMSYKMAPDYFDNENKWIFILCRFRLLNFIEFDVEVRWTVVYTENGGSSKELAAELLMTTHQFFMRGLKGEEKKVERIQDFLVLVNARSALELPKHISPLTSLIEARKNS